MAMSNLSLIDKFYHYLIFSDMFLELPEKYHSTSIRQHVKYHKDVSTSIGLKIVMVSDKLIIPVHSWFWLCFEIDVKYRSALGDFKVYVEPSNLWENLCFTINHYLLVMRVKGAWTFVWMFIQITTFVIIV